MSEPHDRDDRNNDDKPRKKFKGMEKRRRTVVPRAREAQHNVERRLGEMDGIREGLENIRLKTDANEELDECKRRVLSLQGEIQGLGQAYTTITRRLYNLEETLITKLLPYVNFEQIANDANSTQDNDLTRILKRILVLRHRQ